MDLVARDAAFDAAIRSVRFGSGMVIAGEAGVGKTALASAVAESMSQDGVRVIRVLATAAGRSIPYAALGPLLPAGSPDFHPALVPALVLKVLAELPGRALPLLLVDDAQLLDDHSAAALLAVVHQRKVRALVTVRSGGRPSDAVTALWKDRLLERTDLQPLDVAATGILLRSTLRDDVAAMTTQMLWEHSQGNPMYIQELTRYGRDTGHLTRTNGVWWWAGDTDVPPRLAELLQDRLEDLSAVAQEARDLLALGEPLPYDTLAAVVPHEAIMELDSKGLVTSDSSGGVVRLRFSHPLLRSVAARRLTPVRRRALAGRLIHAPADDVDFLRRATWQEAAGGPPDVELLVRASRSLITVDPTTAVRFAERAVAHDRGPGAAVTLADAQAELGQPELALASLATARARARTAADRLMVTGSEASLMLWSLRRPLDAIGIMDRLGAAEPDGPGDDHRSVGALLTLFSARPALAGRLAESVLSGSPEPEARRRSLLVRVASATLGDRPDASRAASAQLARVLSEHPHPESARSLSTAVAATAEMFGQKSADLPRAGRGSGRWPTPYESMRALPQEVGSQPVNSVSGGPVWPLLDGVRLHLAGDHRAAAVALREATVQQLQGEGLFRSEATGGLVVVLAESGQLEEAREVLDAHGPDATALIPGLSGWAQAWVLAASGRTERARELALQTAVDTAAVGAVSTAFWYLADAARLGATQRAAECAEALAGQIGSGLTSARLIGIRARLQDHAEPLLAAAEAHLSLGLFGHAGELAQLCVQRSARSDRRRRDGVDRRARAVLRASRSALGRAPADQAQLPEQLTRRETEIARLAAQGMRDKDIADALVLSVRTVESHLATAYRKLGIASRRELVESLGGSRNPS